MCIKNILLTLRKSFTAFIHNLNYCVFIKLLVSLLGLCIIFYYSQAIFDFVNNIYSFKGSTKITQPLIDLNNYLSQSTLVLYPQDFVFSMPIGWPVIGTDTVAGAAQSAAEGLGYNLNSPASTGSYLIDRVTELRSATLDESINNTNVLDQTGNRADVGNDSDSSVLKYTAYLFGLVVGIGLGLALIFPAKALLLINV